MSYTSKHPSKKRKEALHDCAYLRLKESDSTIFITKNRCLNLLFVFFFSSRRRHTRFDCDWSSDVCSSDLIDLLRNVIELFFSQRSCFRNLLHSAIRFAHRRPNSHCDSRELAFSSHPSPPFGLGPSYTRTIPRVINITTPYHAISSSSRNSGIGLEFVMI